MVLLWSLLVGVLAGLVRKGSLANLGNLPLKALWLVFGALLVQLLVFPNPWSEPPIQDATLVEWLHYASYALIAVFFVLNWRVVTLWVMAVGMLMNALVIVVNGGYMPSSPEALTCAGRVVFAEALQNPESDPPFTYANTVLMSADTKLNFFGDWICIPNWVPFANAISLGDVVLMLGLAWLVQSGMTRAQPQIRSEGDSA